VSHSKDENISQLMWPSIFVPRLEKIINFCVEYAKQIDGHDMIHDFDMMIKKNTNVETPWHQDESLNII